MTEATESHDTPFSALACQLSNTSRTPVSGKRVAIVFRYIPQYRVPFLKRLRGLCVDHGIDLTIIHGQPAAEDAQKSDESSLEYSLFLKSRFIRLGHRPLIWQPVLPLLRQVDLVIVEQQVKLLVNYIFLVGQYLGGPKVAFFGHGRNLQAKREHATSELIKRGMIKMPYWWFAYTESVASYLREHGYPQEKITVFDNATDTSRLRQDSASVTEGEMDQARAALGIASANVCAFVGSMYPDKRLDFLVKACCRIRDRVHDFSMLFIGAGPDEHIVRRFCDDHLWAKYLGPKFGREKVILCKMSRLFLLPGAVGLAVLDAFALGVPLITTSGPNHGPEVDYLSHGFNGIMVEKLDDVGLYAATVESVLNNAEQWQSLAKNCEWSAMRLTIENMSCKFFHGIQQSLVT